MTKRSKTSKSAPLEAFDHKGEVRSNNPTAELGGWMQEGVLEKTYYPRNPDLDPQLVWKGKDAEDRQPLEVDVAPIYVQEHIHPRALIEDLRRQSQKSQIDSGERTADWFDEWDKELDPEDKIEFYQHERPWTNRMILGNSLEVMTSLAKKEDLKGRVQCIYMDPPYGIKFSSNWQPSTQSVSTSRTGSGNELSRDPDVIKVFRDTWKYGVNSYLSYMRDRLIVARDLLTDSGSIFVQISDENMHLVRGVLDEVFESSNYMSTIRFKKRAKTSGGKYLEELADYILWYAKNKEAVKFRRLYLERDYSGDFTTWKYYETKEGKRFQLSKEDIIGQKPLPDGAKRYRLLSLWPASFNKNGVYPLPFRGKDWSPSKGQCYPTTLERMQRLANANYVEASGNYLYKVFRSDEAKYQKLATNWEDTSGAQDKRYVVETSPKVVARCLLMTTEPGDLVLDPTCGSGTTAYVSEMYGRRWITIDSSRVAIALARSRLMSALFSSYKFPSESSGKARLDGEINPKNGFEYDSFMKATIASITNSERIDEIVSEYEKPIADILTAVRKEFGKEINEWGLQELSESNPDNETLNRYWTLNAEKKTKLDKCIYDAAEKTYLYDRPIENRGVKRVTGKFTVESLSPHRVIPPEAEDADLLETLRGQPGHNGKKSPKLVGKKILPKSIENGDAKFIEIVREHLIRAGVENTKKGERLDFESLAPCLRGSYVQFEARYRENGKQKRAAICVGPQYGTVTSDLIRHASNEAASFFDILIVLGYAFEAHANESLINTGRLQVLRVRIHQDLQSANRYEPGKTGNPFVIFGEPDIDFRKTKDGKLQVKILGVDIYNPATGEVSASEAEKDIACWFIDTDYNEEAFFVRHAYFSGGGKDPLKKLKTTLKGEVNEELWATLNKTISRPFAEPASGKIAVKAINHYGDEVLRVFETSEAKPPTD